MRVKNLRRLIVCLDGTWNNEDDSTNVLHHYNLVVEGEVGTGDRSTTQKKHYFRGVGTGPLDRITGGGFGFGLEQNVRDAYNWLVEHYEESDPVDEIYIFGFSRGAYTARSLVGFIGTYGLLRRGAPLSVGQLWENYCILGRRRENRNGPWDRLFAKKENVPRQISTLVIDPWLLPGTRSPAKAEGRSEELLVEWSRRVKITYLGIYETVGAIGWDAMAIPGLRSKLALHHNMRPTTLIQKCRHALAIQEHRSSFRHTPFIAFLGDNQSRGEAVRGQSPTESPRGGRPRFNLEAMWNWKIRQRWFVGAHSNLGGGYPDNVLAQRPLKWILEGAADAGLVCQALREPTIQPEFADSPPRDSYAEFMRPLWTMILRAKRNYRVIDPSPVRRAAAKNNAGKPGFALKHINEGLDESVFTYYHAEDSKPPPNLIEYATRKKELAKGGYREKLSALAQRVPSHRWPEEGVFGAVAVLLWAGLAAAGLMVANRLFLLWPGEVFSWATVAGAAVGFVAIDFGESRMGFALALRGGGAGRRSAKAGLYWLRALGCLLFVLGVGGLPWILFWAGAPGIAPLPGGPGGPGDAMRAAGLALLAQVGVIYFLQAFSWVGKPMREANLGSTIEFQLCVAPRHVKLRLDQWLTSLQGRNDGLRGEARRSALEPVHESIWRDLIGFIPLHTAIAGFGSWFAATQFGWGWLSQWWWIFPAGAASFNYAEDGTRLRFVSLYLRDETPSAALTVVSFAAGLIKFAALGAGVVLTFAVIAWVSVRTFGHPAEAGWRGWIVSSLTSLTLLVIVAIAAGAAIYRATNKPKRDGTTPLAETGGEITSE